MAMRRVLGDAALSQELREKGLARARLFSWQNTARETIEVYRKVLAGTPSPGADPPGTQGTQGTEGTERTELGAATSASWPQRHTAQCAQYAQYAQYALYAYPAQSAQSAHFASPCLVSRTRRPPAGRLRTAPASVLEAQGPPGP
jgi:hypothetical protein